MNDSRNDFIERLRARALRRARFINTICLILIAAAALVCYNFRRRYETAYNPMRDCVVQFRSNSLDIQDLSRTPYQSLTADQKRQLGALQAHQAILASQCPILVAHEQLQLRLYEASLIPILAAILAAAIARAYSSLWHNRAIARAQAGYCINCGYDLRASADRCPECGTLR